jgi:hypothetical protein
MSIPRSNIAVFGHSFSISGYDPTYEDEEECYLIGEEIGKKCKAFGPGLVGAEAGHKTHFLIQVNDLEGQAMTEGGMPITATISDEQRLYYIRIIDNQDGTYSGYYAIGHPGAYDLHIKLNDEHDIEGSPFPIEILPSRTLAENCIAVGENIHACYPGVSSSFIIYSKDVYGNSKQKGGDPFEVSIVGPATLQSLVDNGDGSYTCCFEARSASDLGYFAPSSLLMSITLYGKHISGSPYHPTILSQPPPSIIPAIPPPTDEDLEGDMPSINNSIKEIAISEEKALNEASSRGLTMAEISSEAEASATRKSSPPRITAQKRNSILTKEIAKIEESSGAPLSRLERARQRALMARKLTETHPQFLTTATESPTAASTSTPFADRSTSQSQLTGDSAVRGVRRASVMRSDIDPITGLPINMKKGAAAASSISQPQSTIKGEDDSKSGSQNWNITDAELSKLLNPQPLITAASTASANRDASQTRRASIQRTDIDPITGLPIKPKAKASSSANQPASSNQETSKSANDGLADAISLVSSSGVLSKPDIDAVISSFTSGMSGSIPPGSGDEERVMWEYTDRALLSSDVVTRLVSSLPMLKSSFELMSTIVEGTAILKLTNASNSSGAFRLLEEFDVVPTYLSMREVKKAFSLILAAQRNAKAASSLAGGGTGIDFIHYIKFLVMLAVYGLSKTTAFVALYKTDLSKVS